MLVETLNTNNMKRSDQIKSSIKYLNIFVEECMLKIYNWKKKIKKINILLNYIFVFSKKKYVQNKIKKEISIFSKRAFYS